MQYDVEIVLDTGEKSPIYGTITTPIVAGVQSTFTVSTATFTAYYPNKQPVVGFVNVNIIGNFPSGAQINPTGYIDFDTTNPGNMALVKGIYTGIMTISGTGSDGVARTKDIVYRIVVNGPPS